MSEFHLPEIRAALLSAERVVILTGAGLSAESGIPTFRDSRNGLWRNVDPMKVASLQGFLKNPDEVWRWHDDLRKMLATAKPNHGHECIAQLQQLLPGQLQVLTQNIDGLHQIAGSSEVLELHGSLSRICCGNECGFSSTWDDAAPRLCPECGRQTRPSVVWFGESLDEKVFAQAKRACLRADVLIVAGTSGVVQPAAGLAHLAKTAGAMTVEVNLTETPFSRLADHSIRASSSEFLLSLGAALRKPNLH